MTWKLSDYYTGKSYDEAVDEAKAKLQSPDFSAFEEGQSMAVPRHADFKSEPVEEGDFPLPVDISGLDLTRPPALLGR